MVKDDWYFVIGVILALLPFFGVDWQYLKSHKKFGLILRVSLILGGLCCAAYGGYSLALRQFRDYPEWKAAEKSLQEVRNQTFRNEEVVVDGKSFDNCTFVNVTFVYKATDTFMIANNDIIGTTILKVKMDTRQASVAAMGANFVSGMVNQCFHSPQCDIRNNVRVVIEGP